MDNPQNNIIKTEKDESLEVRLELFAVLKGDCPDPFGQEIVRIGTPTRVDRYYQHTRLEETASAINITDGEDFPSKSFLPSSDALLSNDLFNLGPSSRLMHEDMIA